MGGSRLRLLRLIDGIPARAKFLILQLLVVTLRGAGLKPRITTVLRFRGFTLEFLVGHGELTPLEEIRKQFVERVLPVLTTPLAEMTIVDCGANVGLFSLHCLGAKRIIALEPNPDCFGRLERNFLRNRVPGRALAQAVGSREGKCWLEVKPGSTVFSRVSVTGDHEVPITTVDRLIREEGLERVDLLKLDVEGHEVQALEGASASLAAGTIRAVYVEYNSPETLHALDTSLAKHSFQRVITEGWNALYRIQ